MTRVLSLALLATSAVASSACTPTYQATGRIYLAQANLPVAIAYFDRGMASNPGDAEIRADLILAQQMYIREVRRQQESLVANGRFRKAFGRMVLLDDIAYRTKELSLPTEIDNELNNERSELLKKAITQLERELDERASRGQASISDLKRCRELETIVDDESVARRCDRLLDRFKLYAAVDVASDAGPLAPEVRSGLIAELKKRNPQLLEVVPEGHEKLNARIQVFTGEPVEVFTDWHMVARDAYVTWVPRKDRKGRLVKETVEVKLTQKEIDALKRQRKAQTKAKGNKAKAKPIPKTKKVQKQVYDQVSGEYRVFGTARRVTVPWSFAVNDMRGNKLVLVRGGDRTAKAQERYHEFRGDQRARKAIPNAGPEGRGRARALPSGAELINRAVGGLANESATMVINAIE